MKIDYITRNGIRSTAYAEDDPEQVGEDLLYQAEDKYSDRPMWVRWDEDLEAWVEVAQ